MYVCIFNIVYVCMYVYLYCICNMYICVCMYVCMYICMYVCMLVYVSNYFYILSNTQCNCPEFTSGRCDYCTIYSSISTLLSD